MSDSYSLIASKVNFAMHGVLQVDCLAVTQTIDPLGISVVLDGLDTVLQEQTPFSAMNDELLVFIDDEVFSVYGWTLTGPATYQILTIRGRFATPRQAHAAGSDVFIIAREDLVALQHALFQPGNTAEFKIAPRGTDGIAEVGDMPEIDIAIAGRIFKQTPVINLRVNGHHNGATFAPGAAVQIDWTTTTAGAELAQKELLSFRVRLELFDADMNPLGSMETPAGSQYLPNASLVALLGGVEQSFWLKATFVTRSDFATFLAPEARIFVTKL